MKRVAFVVFASAVTALVVAIAWAQPPKGGSEGRGFGFGGAPEIDRPPLPRDDKEKQALAALDEMSRGKWYLNVTTREGRVRERPGFVGGN